MARKIESLRNIGIIAHIDAGKTTLTENMLYQAGSKHIPGAVDKGTTLTDDDPEEGERGITIYSACVSLDWKDVAINLLDTPGHVDFTAEVERCLRVLDGAVVVFSGREGVEAQSETVWRQANRYQVPRIIYINKVDREGADFDRVFTEIQDRLESNPIAIQIPYGAGPEHLDDAFRGVIDLIEMKLLVFDSKSFGREFQTLDIPEDAVDRASVYRELMLEALYEQSNEMMELALSEEPIPNELIYKVLREATIHMAIQPVLCGSALRHIGVQPVLDAVANFLPSPLDRPPVEGFEPGKKPDIPVEDLKKIARKPSPKDPFSALVFKIIPEKTADQYWLRVYSGELKANSRAYVPGKDKKENIAQLWQIRASRKEPKGQVDSVSTGDIVCAIGPRHAVTGDTLCDGKNPILLESIDFPESVISMAIEPESTAERKKLADALLMLERQDPTFDAVENEELGQTLISGMGELHLEIIQHRLERDFKVKVKFHKPRVSYRETVSKAIEVVGQCNRMVEGQQLFGEVKLKVEPFKGDNPVFISNRCPPDTLPPEIIAAVMDQLRSKAEGGGLSSFPLFQIRITFLGGAMHEEGSTEMAYSIAAAEAFEKGLREAGPVLLEPVMKVDISTPEDYYGDFVNDIQKRRGVIARTEQRGDRTVIEAHTPLSELFGYSGAMRSLSQGRASSSVSPFEYRPAPVEIGKEYGL
ncbi:MAG: elongation factor G [bacterium]|nr:elongation factor G [bacterium]